MFQKSTMVMAAALTFFLVPLASAATCSTDTLADYVANGSCTLGDLTFSNISAVAGARNYDLHTKNINVVPITTPNDPGLSFDHSFDAVGYERFQTLSVSFTVTDTAGSLIDDIGVAFNSGHTGLGTATFEETYCSVSFANLAGFDSNGCRELSVTNPASNFSESLTLPTAVSSLTITKELIFNTNGRGTGDNVDTATGSFGASTFDPVGNNAVPEPRSISLLLGLGLLAGVIVSKRVQTARS